MVGGNEARKAQFEKGDKSARAPALLPPGRERVTQGQQFDEMQRQQKNPDGSPREKDES